MSKLEAVPDQMTIVNLQVLLMPNGELLCQGKTVGWFDSLKKYITVEEPKNDSSSQ